MGFNLSGVPGFRLFIFGQEVTRDVASITFSWNDDRAPSMASFTLVNQDSRYIVTAEDLHAMYGNLSPETVTYPEDALADDPTYEGVGAAVLDELPLSESAAQILGTSLSAEAQNTLVTNTAAIQEARRIQLAEKTTRAVRAIDKLAGQVADNIVDFIRDEIKSRVLTAKVGIREAFTQPDFTETYEVTDVLRAAHLAGQVMSYPIACGDCIFHSNDPVRLVVRDPFEGRIWYWGFSGYVTDWGETIGVNSEQQVTIVCEDSLRPVRLQRFVTNAGLFDIKAMRQQEDLILRTLRRENFSEMTVEELVYTILFGPALPNTSARLGIVGPDAEQIGQTITHRYYSVNNPEGTPHTRSLLAAGAYNFERSLTFYLGPDLDEPAAKSSPQVKARRVYLDGQTVSARTAPPLALYQAAVDHRVVPDDLYNMILPGMSPSPRLATYPPSVDGQGFSDLTDIITAIGENPDLYPVDAGRVVMLLPRALGTEKGRRVQSLEMIDSVATKTSWTTRLSALYDLLERLEFRLHASPRGDILVELPLYDFDPDDFGRDAVRASDLKKVLGPRASAQFPAESAGVAVSADQVYGPFAPRYRVARHEMGTHSRQFSDEPIRTQARTHYKFVQGLDQDNPVDAQVVTLRSLVGCFGVRTIDVEPHTFIASPEAAAYFGHVRLNQQNAEAYENALTLIPRLTLGPNRPIEVAERRYIATLRNVSHSMVWGSGGSGSVDTSISLNYTRLWYGQTGDVDRDTGKPRLVYEALGGAASRPLNWAVLLLNRSFDQSGVLK